MPLDQPKEPRLSNERLQDLAQRHRPPQEWYDERIDPFEPFIIRRATPEDAEAITPVHVASIRMLCAKDYTPEQIDAWAGWKSPDKYRAAMAAGELFFVAEVDGRVVGFSVLFGDEVKAVYLHPDHVGRGIGRRLLAAVEAEAQANGVSELKLTSTLTSVRFYESCGYAKGELHQHPVTGGVMLPCVHFTKRL